MKKVLLSVTVVALSGIILSTSCKKDEESAFDVGQRAGKEYCDCVKSQSSEICDELNDEEYSKYDNDYQFALGFLEASEGCWALGK